MTPQEAINRAKEFSKANKEVLPLTTDAIDTLISISETAISAEPPTTTITTITNPAKGIIEKKIEELREEMNISSCKRYKKRVEYLRTEISTLGNILPLIPDIELPGDEEIAKGLWNEPFSKNGICDKGDYVSQRIIGAKWLRDKIQKQITNK